MFGWLLRLFKRRDPMELYTPKERAIFWFFDGQTVRKADPMVLFKRVMDKANDISIAYKVARSESKDARLYHEKFIGYIRDIFEIKRLEEGGLTETETATLLDRLMDYIDDVKKNSSPLPPLPAPSPSSSSPSDASPATPNGSASTSTEKTETTESPPPFHSARERLSEPSTLASTSGEVSPTEKVKP